MNTFHRKSFWAVWGVLAVAASGGGCGQSQSGGGIEIPTPAASAAPTASPSASPSDAPGTAPPVTTTTSYTYSVVNTYPHDRQAFTQGLFIQNGALYESTGLNGFSSLRKDELPTGKVLQKKTVPSEYFAEGLTEWQGKLYQLTWQAHKGFIYDQTTFEKTGEFKYTGEGWGLTHDDKYLILSDGTSKIRFLDPKTFAVVKTISVSDGGTPVDQLNELEYIKGEIWSNVWQTNYLVRIAPDTGKIVGWVDLSDILPYADRDASTDVLNGIAYDKTNDRIFVTGKKWPKIFEIKVTPKP